MVILKDQASSIADHIEANMKAKRDNDKKACGTVIHDLMVMAVYEVTIDKLKETGSYQKCLVLNSII